MYTDNKNQCCNNENNITPDNTKESEGVKAR